MKVVHTLRNGAAPLQAPVRALLVLLLLILVSAAGLPAVAGTSVRAQAPTPGEATYTLSLDQLVVQPDGDEVTAYVSVLDPQGEPVEGLTAFSATIDDRAAEIESIEPAVNGDIPIAALLAIDVSDSMAGEPLEQAKTAARTFLSELGPDDEVAIVSFGETVEEVLPFSTDRAAANEAIDSLATNEAGSGGDATALYDGTIRSVQDAVGSGNPRATVILLSDGVDSASEASLEDAVSEVEASQVPVFTISLGGTADLDPAYLRHLANISGGRFSHIPSPEGLEDVYASLAAQLRGQYALRVVVPEGPAGERELIIRITLGERVLSATSTFDPQVPNAALDEGGGGVPAFALVAVAVAAALVLIAAVIWYRRRRSRPRHAVGPGAVPPPSARGASPTPANGAAAPAPVGQLTVIEGPNAGASVTLSAQPVDIGAAPSCDLRLDAADGTGLRHARVWLQNDRFVIHHLARGATTYVAGEPVEWATLEKDDTVRIGPHVLTVTITKA